MKAHKKVAEIVDRKNGSPGFDVMIVADTQSFNYWPAMPPVQSAKTGAFSTFSILRSSFSAKFGELDAEPDKQPRDDGPLWLRRSGSDGVKGRENGISAIACYQSRAGGSYVPRRGAPPRRTAAREPRVP